MNPVKQRRIWQLPNGKIVDGHSWNMSTHRHICERCNQWMGATYEAPVSALIRRLVDLEHELTLAREQQRLLANWAYKTMLMLECTSVGGPTVERGESIRFRIHGRPPSDCSIVVGVSEHSALAYHRSIVEVPGHRVGYLATLVIDHLVSHIIGDVGALNPHDRLVARYLRNGNLLRLYPSSGQSTDWPINGYLSKQAVERLASLGILA